MQPPAPITPSHEFPKGLPPVVPPSGKFIAQLFLVPFIIVAAVVALLLGINWMVGSARSPDDFLARLDNENPDVRWRGAEDLAQVLLRDDQLASDPKFALDLAERLERAVAANSRDEKEWRDRVGQAKIGPDEIQAKNLQPGQDQVLYLSGCLGNVMLPVAVPILNDLALGTDGSDPQVVARRRWRAVWVLANLGQSLKRLDKLQPYRREAVLNQLEQQAATGGHRAEWARLALDFVQGPRAGSLDLLKVHTTLVRCAEDADPFLREIAAFAMNFWEGTAEENGLLENALVKLSRDDGHGEELVTRFRDDPQAPEEAITSNPGLKIRYNATIALARRGSAKVRLGLLEEMLEEERQLQNFRIRRKNGTEVADEPAAAQTIVTALQSIAELHRRNPAFNLTTLNPALDALAQSPKLALRTEAERTRKLLAEGSVP